MKRDMDDILKHALSPSMTPDPRLNQRIIKIYQRKEQFYMKETMYRKPRMRARTAVAIAICCVLAVGSVTTYAAWKLLGAKDVAEKNGDLKLAEAFVGEDAVPVNETQICGGYRITLLGAVAGRNISEYLVQETVDRDRLYTVVAIERADGTPMPDTSDDAYGDETFLVSPYVKGLAPGKYNAFTLNGSYSEMVIDGVQYRILESDSVELFADRGVYIGVSDGTFYNRDAFLYDETTGEITKNGNYAGVNALFTLPLNPDHADPDAAQALLDAIDAGEDTEAPTGGADGQPEAAASFQQWLSAMQMENNLVDQGALFDRCAVIPRTVRTYRITDDTLSYVWDLGDQGSGAGTMKMSAVFPQDSAPGVMVFLNWEYSLGGDAGDEDPLRSAKLTTALLNDDGSVTVAVYVPKEYLERYAE